MKTDSATTRKLTWFGLAFAIVVFPQIANAQWTTSGNDVYKANTAGNVGIGTNSPAQKLDVVGNILLDSSGNWYGINKASGEARAVMFNGAVLSDNDYLYFGSLNNGFKFVDANNTPLLTIKENGNVGIGTTSPSQILDIKAPTAIVGLQSTTGANRAFFVAYNGGGHTYAGTENSAGNGIFNSDLAYASVFGTVDSNAVQFATNNVSRMTIDNGGNVGIGTTSPSSKLHVTGAIDSNYAAQVLNTMTTAGHSFGMFLKGGTNSSDWALAIRDSNDNDLARLLGNGNFGIGTTSPYTKLQVAGGDISIDADHAIRKAGDNSIIAYSSNLPGIVIGSGTTTDQVIINAGGYERARILTNGNVGIGTTSPGYKLDVNGNTNVSGNITASGTINAKYQDVAEWVPSSEQLSPGTVVVLDSTKSNQVTSSTVSYDTRVAGVVSDQPGLALGEKSESKVLVATTGRVRVKVDASKGPIHIGDLLVTSDIPGVAMKSDPVILGGVQIHRPGTLIGKALEPLEKGSGEILVLLSLQ